MNKQRQNWKELMDIYDDIYPDNPLTQDEKKWMRKLAQTEDGKVIVEATMQRKLGIKQPATGQLPVGTPDKPMSWAGVKAFPSSEVFFRHVRQAQSVMYRLRIQQQRDPGSIDYDHEFNKVIGHVERAMKFHQPRLVREKRAVEELYFNIGKFASRYQHLPAPLIGKRDKAISIETLHDVLAMMDEGHEGPPDLSAYEGDADTLTELTDYNFSGNYFYENKTSAVKFTTWDLRPADEARAVGNSWPKDMVSPVEGLGSKHKAGGYWRPENLADGKERTSYLRKRKAWDEAIGNKQHHKPLVDAPWHRSYHHLPYNYIEEPMMYTLGKDRSVRTLYPAECEQALKDYEYNRDHLRGYPRHIPFGGAKVTDNKENK